MVVNVTEGYRPVIALNHEWPQRHFVVFYGTTGGQWHLYVFVDAFAVEIYVHESRIGNLVAVRIKARSLKGNLYALPQAGSLRRVGERGLARVHFAFIFRLPIAINTADIAIARILLPPTVQQLNFITTL